jgi:2-keto-3-deoxy-L-rhamnonate aldolase RhmA
LGLDPLPENPHPIFQEALREIQRAALAHHLPLGIYCSNGKAAAARIRQGFLLVNVASDVNLLQRGVLAELETSQWPQPQS